MIKVVHSDFINDNLCFEPVLGLFSVVSLFADMIFKLVFSCTTTFINVILHFELALSLSSAVSVFAEMNF